MFESMCFIYLQVSISKLNEMQYFMFTAPLPPPFFFLHMDVCNRRSGFITCDSLGKSAEMQWLCSLLPCTWQFGLLQTEYETQQKYEGIRIQATKDTLCFHSAVLCRRRTKLCPYLGFRFWATLTQLKISHVLSWRIYTDF